MSKFFLSIRPCTASRLTLMAYYVSKLCTNPYTHKKNLCLLYRQIIMLDGSLLLCFVLCYNIHCISTVSQYVLIQSWWHARIKYCIKTAVLASCPTQITNQHFYRPMPLLMLLLVLSLSSSYSIDRLLYTGTSIACMCLHNVIT